MSLFNIHLQVDLKVNHRFLELCHDIPSVTGNPLRASFWKRRYFGHRASHHEGGSQSGLKANSGKIQASGLALTTELHSKLVFPVSLVFLYTWPIEKLWNWRKWHEVGRWYPDLYSLYISNWWNHSGCENEKQVSEQVISHSCWIWQSFRSFIASWPVSNFHSITSCIVAKHDWNT